MRTLELSLRKTATYPVRHVVLIVLKFYNDEVRVSDERRDFGEQLVKKWQGTIEKMFSPMDVDDIMGNYWFYFSEEDLAQANEAYEWLKSAAENAGGILFKFQRWDEHMIPTKITQDIDGEDVFIGNSDQWWLVEGTLQTEEIYTEYTPEVDVDIEP